ncbi:MAG: hypothetical protein AAF907_13290, partial [Planctomycetota bacterium]
IEDGSVSDATVPIEPAGEDVATAAEAATANATTTGDRSANPPADPTTIAGGDALTEEGTEPAAPDATAEGDGSDPDASPAGEFELNPVAPPATDG